MGASAAVEASAAVAASVAAAAVVVGSAAAAAELEALEDMMVLYKDVSKFYAGRVEI